MRIPPYWANEVYSGKDRKGNEHAFRAWGWSFEGLAAAKADALARAKRIFDRLTSGAQLEHYGYANPLREEIIDSVSHHGDELAVITRNSYGALVLNSASVCFADVDFPQVRAQGFLDALLLLFSKTRQEERRQAAVTETVRRIEGWAERNPDRSFRLYRTAGGLRLLFTDRLYQPTSHEVASLLSDLGSDRLYRRLTETQECFRARLTPKPWRCGCSKPPNRYPWDDPQAERKYREWQRGYEEKARKYSTCRLLGAIGNGFSDQRIGAVVSVHDRFALGDPQAALA